MSNLTYIRTMNFYFKDLPEETGARFKAACALDSLTMREVFEKMMVDYANQRLKEVHKNQSKK